MFSQEREATKLNFACSTFIEGNNPVPICRTFITRVCDQATKYTLFFFFVMTNWREYTEVCMIFAKDADLGTQRLFTAFNILF